MATNDENRSRLDSEWVSLNALRELIRLATHGDSGKATYDQALALGEKILPQILGEDSLIKRAKESDVAREFRQKAQAKTRQTGNDVTALELLNEEITDYKGLLQTGRNQQRTDQLSRRLGGLERAYIEIHPERHSENQLIIRDAYVAHRDYPQFGLGTGYRDFILPDRNRLRLRVFHPERPEFITGADVIYERHNEQDDTVNLVAIQYKIWEDKSLPLGDQRLQSQLERLKAFLCDRQMCTAGPADHEFRFPYCSAFLRPTDRLQSADQKLMSTGEHLPICQIDKVQTATSRGVTLEYHKILPMSLSQDAFEGLFTSGKLGSRTLTHAELEEFYRAFNVISDTERVLIHAQDLPDDSGDSETLF